MVPATGVESDSALIQENATPRLRTRFVRGAAWSLAGSVLARGFTIAGAVVCARLLGKTSFGQLGIIQSTVGVFSVFGTLGLGLTATRFVAEFRSTDAKRAGRVIALSTMFALIAGVATSLLLVALCSLLARRLLAAPEIALPLAMASGLVLFGSLNSAEIGALIGFEAFRPLATMNLIAGAVGFAATAAGVWLAGLNGAVAGLVVTTAFNWALNAVAVRKLCARYGVRIDFGDCFQEARLLGTFSVPAFLASAIVMPVMFACNAMLVHQTDGYAQLGVYVAADRWRLALLFVPTSILNMALPLLANLQGEGNQSGYRKVVRANLVLSAALIVLPAVAIALLAPHAMSIFGSAYRGGSSVLVILCFSAMFEAANTIFGQPLITRRMWLRFGFDVLLAATLLISAYVLIPRWGARGLAVAYCVAFATVSLCLMVVSLRHLRLGEQHSA